jgi:hypothetical protein
MKDVYAFLYGELEIALRFWRTNTASLYVFSQERGASEVVGRHGHPFIFKNCHGEKQPLCTQNLPTSAPTAALTISLYMWYIGTIGQQASSRETHQLMNGSPIHTYMLVYLPSITCKRKIDHTYQAVLLEQSVCVCKKKR